MASRGVAGDENHGRQQATMKRGNSVELHKDRLWIVTTSV